MTIFQYGLLRSVSYTDNEGKEMRQCVNLPLHLRHIAVHNQAWRAATFWDNPSTVSSMASGIASSSKSAFAFRPIHLEALMLALFKRLRTVWFGLLVSFCESIFTSSESSGWCDLGLWRVDATEAAVLLSTSAFWSRAASLGTQTRSLGNEACCLCSGVLPLPLLSPLP